MIKKSTLRLVAIIVALVFTAFKGQSQTTLTAGDIAFTGINSTDPDQFSFVLLQDVTAGTVIRFTDNGWLSTNAFRGNEGTIKWTASANMNCGTQVTIASVGVGASFTATSGAVTLVSSSGTFLLATSGDQIFAYQGTDTVPVFIAAINTDGAWVATATSASNSALPAALTNHTNAVALVNGTKNAKYNCVILNGGKAVIDTAVNDSLNWAIDNTNRETLPPTCNFSCSNLAADCAGVPGGSAFYDNCNICAGGTTGITPNLDTDGDGTLDCNDGCPNDPNKIAPGICGCGKADTSLADAGNDVTICQGQVATFTATGGGTYHWSNNANTASSSASPLAGTYTYAVTVTNPAGCVTSDSLVVTVNALPHANAGADTFVCIGSSVTITATGGVSYVWSNGDQTASTTYSGNINTSLTVTVTDANTCIAYDTVNITANATPVADAGFDQVVCTGDSVQLIGNGGPSYTWSTGATTSTITVSPTVPTDYILTVSSNGCSSTDTVHVAVNPLPVIDLGPDKSVCAGDTLVLSISNIGGFYLWGSGETSPTLTVIPNGTNTYTLKYTDNNTCVTHDSVTVSVNQLPVFDLGPDKTICAGTSTLLSVNIIGTYLWSTGDTAFAITVSPSVTTPYSVVFTDVNGCSASDNVSVLVNQLPNINASASHALCAGDTATITVIGAVSYVWSNGATTNSISVTPTQTATYIVTGTDTNNCTGKDSTTITVHGLPTVSFTGLNASYCNDAAAVTLTGSPVGGTFVGDGITGNTFNPNAAGGGSHVIVYAYADANLCAGTANDTVVVDTCTGIANVGNDVAVSVYPNPFTGQLIVEVGTQDQNMQINLFDLMGRVVMAREIAGGTNNIAIPTNLPAGMYLLEVKGNGTIKTFRLLHAQ